jgi:hypothetical protein
MVDAARSARGRAYGGVFGLGLHSVNARNRMRWMVDWTVDWSQFRAFGAAGRLNTDYKVTLVEKSLERRTSDRSIVVDTASRSS